MLLFRNKRCNHRKNKKHALCSSYSSLPCHYHDIKMLFYVSSNVFASMSKKLQSTWLSAESITAQHNYDL